MPKPRNPQLLRASFQEATIERWQPMDSQIVVLNDIVKITLPTAAGVDLPVFTGGNGFEFIKTGRVPSLRENPDPNAAQPAGIAIMVSTQNKDGSIVVERVHAARCRLYPELGLIPHWT